MSSAGLRGKVGRNEPARALDRSTTVGAVDGTGGKDRRKGKEGGGEKRKLVLQKERKGKAGREKGGGRAVI